MKRRQFLKTAAAGIAGLIYGCSSFRKNTKNRIGNYNVILINVDDQGYGDLSCHGNPILKTPNLDKLHSESVRLTDFHVNPFCAPTRASLLTGKLSDRVKVWRTLNMRNYLSKDELTIGDIFKSSGYKTALFGKWHLGHNYPYRPIDRGFDVSFGIGDGGLAATSDYWENDRFNDHYEHNGKWEFEKGFNTDVIVDRSIEWVTKNSISPFFLYLAPNVPHGPWNVKSDWIDPYKNKGMPEEVDLYYASIERMDWNIGRFLKFLKKKEFYDNSIVIFITDNGSSHFQNPYNAGMRGFKISVYEGGHRVPCFIHGPENLFGKPRDIDTLTGHIDILPTLADICSLHLPEDIDMDGRSLKPLLQSEKPHWPDRAWVLQSQNFTDKPEKWKSSVVIDEEWKTSVVMTQQWRLIDGEELYDIRKDPGQNNNIAPQYPNVVAKLRRIYEQHWKKCGLDGPQPYERPVIGTKYQPKIELGPDAWVLDSPKDLLWWQGRVRVGKKVNGYWPIEAAKSGVYRFDVRRWPEYVNAAITGIPQPYSVEQDVIEMKAWSLPECKALPVAEISLIINGSKYSKTVKENDTVVSFDVPLKKGHADVRATFLDNEKNEISGAYYVYPSYSS